jgi:multicomponent Na+:H+ antiporter subunit C
MEVLLAILVGVLYTAGVYMLLRRSILKFIIGIIFMSNATNLLVFLAAGIIPGQPVFIEAEQTPTNSLADPLPQALVLTAIVIGFALLCFALLLAAKVSKMHGHTDVSKYRDSEPASPVNKQDNKPTIVELE